MAWSQERFTKEMRKFDPYLRLRKSTDGRRWIIERKCARESKCLVKPNDRRKRDDYIAQKDGYIFVMGVPLDRLTHGVFLELRAHDMWTYRGAGPYADALEAQEARDEAIKEQQASGRFQDSAREMYDKLRFVNGSEVGGFQSKVGGYEPGTQQPSATPLQTAR